jgi:hypothetical protein
MSTAHWGRKRYEAALHVSDDLGAAPRSVLLDGLQHRLERMETAVDEDSRDTYRWVAGRIVSELVKRHGLELES